MIILTISLERILIKIISIDDIFFFTVLFIYSHKNWKS